MLFLLNLHDCTVVVAIVLLAVTAIAVISSRLIFVVIDAWVPWSSERVSNFPLFGLPPHQEPHREHQPYANRNAVKLSTDKNYHREVVDTLLLHDPAIHILTLSHPQCSCTNYELLLLIDAKPHQIWSGVMTRCVRKGLGLRDKTQIKICDYELLIGIVGLAQYATIWTNDTRTALNWVTHNWRSGGLHCLNSSFSQNCSAMDHECL